MKVPEKSLETLALLFFLMTARGLFPAEQSARAKNSDSLRGALEFLRREPYAVRYRINDVNHMGMSVHASVLEGRAEVFPDSQNGYDFLTGECLYVCHPESGRERFQFTQAIQPYASPGGEEGFRRRTMSVTRLEDCCAVFQKSDDDAWSDRVTIQDADYMNLCGAGRFRYPFFGAALKGDGSQRRIFTLPEALAPFLETKQPQNDLSSIRIDLNETKITVEWRDSIIPRVIRYQSSLGPISESVEILGVGSLSGARLYPRRARVLRRAAGMLWRETEIEVTEFITGEKALERYPLFPASTRDLRLIDQRKNRERPLDPALFPGEPGE